MNILITGSASGLGYNAGINLAKSLLNDRK